jgi:hypothetical protein
MVGLMTACTASVAIAAAQTSPQAPAAPARGAAAPAAKPLDIYVVDNRGWQGGALDFADRSDGAHRSGEPR